MNASEFRSALARWYRDHGRDLPWRRTRDPYAILVSETMLQQTQVARVVPRHLAWLERWPTIETLAAAPRADVIRAWQGLGYNRSAMNLHPAAELCSSPGCARAGPWCWWPLRRGPLPSWSRGRAGHWLPAGSSR